MNNSKYLKLSKIKDNDELIQQILDYYSEHSLRETREYFKISNKISLHKFLVEHGVEIHSKKFTFERQTIRFKETCQKRYGVSAPGQVEEFKEKAKKTNLKRYGVENVSQNSEIKKKKEQTCIAHFGVPYYTQTEEYKERVKQINLKNYGVEFYLQSEDLKNKSKKFYLDNFGTEYYTQTEEFKQKAKATNIERYGYASASKAPEIQEKMRQTNLRIFGTEYASQNQQIKNKIKQTLFANYGTYHVASQKFKYQDIYFDSFPELCIYLYCINNNIKVKREPIELKYIYNSKEYSYYPDFKINDELIEVKGNQFLTEDGKWCNPYDHTIDEQMEAKHQCALANNVKILYNNDYQKYLDWFYANNYKKENFLIKCEN